MAVALVLRRLPDENGHLVTYMEAPALREYLGVSSSTLAQWKEAGCIRCLPELRGRAAYAVLDVVKLRTTPVRETLAEGIRRCTPEFLREHKKYKDQAYLDTVPTADQAGEEWDSHDVLLLKDMYEAGADLRSIAQELGRTYAAVTARACQLRKEGELPLPDGVTEDWVRFATAFLTRREKEEVEV